MGIWMRYQKDKTLQIKACDCEGVRLERERFKKERRGDREILITEQERNLTMAGQLFARRSAVNRQ
jgi:hypothetical protein